MPVVPPVPVISLAGSWHWLRLERTTSSRWGTSVSLVLRASAISYRRTELKYGSQTVASDGWFVLTHRPVTVNPPDTMSSVGFALADHARRALRRVQAAEQRDDVTADHPGPAEARAVLQLVPMEDAGDSAG